MKCPDCKDGFLNQNLIGREFLFHRSETRLDKHSITYFTPTIKEIP